MNVENIDFDRYEGVISEDEVRCNCGKIHQDHVKQEFMDKLFRARKKSGVPYRYTCICRCPEHNAAVGGVSKSGHLSSENHDCCAADIAFSDNHQLALILKGLFSEYDRVGIDRKRKFVHVDMKDEPAACWGY
jgi:uncharacterized protein YcbK (DUF882 family)